MEYGELPKVLGEMEIQCDEMMFYQYLPIKLIGDNTCRYENRLKCFDKLIGQICSEFVYEYGFEEYINSYIYLTSKHMYQTLNNSYNRLGYHSDGFMTDDINYVWCDKNPTIFNKSKYHLTLDDKISIKEMESQSLTENEIIYPENSILRLNQYNIHKVSDIPYEGMRTFVKLSFSKDKYDLLGNSHNYEIDYNWDMKSRNIERNIPQSLK